MSWRSSLVMGSDGSAYPYLDRAADRLDITWTERGAGQWLRLSAAELPRRPKPVPLPAEASDAVPCFADEHTWWVGPTSVWLYAHASGTVTLIPGFAGESGELRCYDDGLLITGHRAVWHCGPRECTKVAAVAGGSHELKVYLDRSLGYVTGSLQFGFLFIQRVGRDDRPRLVFRAPDGAKLHGLARWGGTLYAVVRLGDAVSVAPIALD